MCQFQEPTVLRTLSHNNYAARERYLAVLAPLLRLVTPQLRSMFQASLTEYLSTIITF
jgi:hypothetical protein